MPDRMEYFKNLTANQIVISDGGLGTLLQIHGLAPGSPPEVFNLQHPEILRKIHREYYEAGARLITTNTFGASPLKLKQAGLISDFFAINSSAVRLAHDSVGEDAFIACSVGPTGHILYPYGTLSISDAFQNYLQQVEVLQKAGGDFIIIETMNDIMELLAAVRACKTLGMPFIGSMTFDERLRTLSGSTPEILAVCLEPHQPLAIGSNCGSGPERMSLVINELARTTHLPLIAQPNAGVPQLIHGNTVFDCSPDDFAESGGSLIKNGASIVGGCCGTTPDHIRKLAVAVRDFIPEKRRKISSTRFASRTKVYSAGNSNSLLIIGERINPTGRKKLALQLKENDFSGIRQDAVAQMQAGAHLLDINSGIPEIIERELMVKMIDEVQSAAPDAALSIDSNDIAALNAGLSAAAGRPLLNSINGDPDRLERLIHVVKESGANFIALAMDETGVPETFEARVKIIEKIIRFADDAGIDRNRILIDSLVFTVGSQPRQAIETLKTVRWIAEQLGCCSSLGVSNVSFGLPARDLLSSVFLAMAMGNGLGAAIINPLSGRMMETVRSAELLLNRDPGGKRYVAFTESNQASGANAAALLKIKESKAKQEKSNLDLHPIANAVIGGDREGIKSLLDQAIASNINEETILSEYLMPAIAVVGKRYGSGEIFLPQLILAGETMKVAVSYIQPQLQKSSNRSLHLTPVVIGTVEGDIHDIGKNIVSIVLENQGFKVIDLGKDVKPQLFVDSARSNSCKIVALSALMTTTLPAMERTVRELKKEIPGVTVMVGGAVVTQSYADKIEADGYAKEAVAAGDIAKKLAGIST